MIRRSPAELYLKYLVLHPKRYTNEQIKEICDLVQLDFLGKWYVDRLRARLKPPVPFYPFDKYHTPSYRFLMTEGLSWIFFPDKSGFKAFDILERARIKEYVEAMIASNAPHTAIAHGVGRQFRYTCDSTVIDRYKEFFWNVDLLDMTELRALLLLRVDQLENHSNPEIKEQHKSVKSASYKDARRAAANMPFSPYSALITQAKMGVMPSQFDMLRLTRMAHEWATVRANEELMSNGNGSSSRAVEYSTIARNFNEILKDVNKPDSDLREQLATIAMRTDDVSLPNIHQLSQGRHTADVVVMSTTHELPADLDDGDAGEEPAPAGG